MKRAADVLEVVGLVAVAVGAWMLSPWAALIVGGVLVVVVAQVLERKR